MSQANNHPTQFQINRDLLTLSINEILFFNRSLPKVEKKNANARMLVASLAGLLAINEPGMSNALCQLTDLEPIAELKEEK